MLRRRVARLCFLVLAGWLCAVAHLRAHELQPAYLELRQETATDWHVLWKLPLRAAGWSRPADDLHPRLPASCEATNTPVVTTTEDAQLEQYTVRVSGALAGSTVGLDGAAAAIADVLVRVVPLDGTTQVARLTPAQPSMVVAAQAGRAAQAFTYLRLGAEHIVLGVDHLLFVLGLLGLVSGWRMLLRTITSFTIAHSITLAIATLGYASAPLPPLNAAIALSILFLGPEMIRIKRGETSLTIRHPWAVAFSFGLLHGFGFASGLTTLGLPHAEIPWALLWFNVGVELGQLAFVALILGLARSFRTLEIRWPRWALSLPAWTVGGLGGYWTVQRTVILFQSLR